VEPGGGGGGGGTLEYFEICYSEKKYMHEVKREVELFLNFFEENLNILTQKNYI
jgi:hypothetical protein